MQHGTGGGEGVFVCVRVCVSECAGRWWGGGGGGGGTLHAQGYHEYDPRDMPLWARVRFWGGGAFDRISASGINASLSSTF